MKEIPTLGIVLYVITTLYIVWGFIQAWPICKLGMRPKLSLILNQKFVKYYGEMHM